MTTFEAKVSFYDTQEPAFDAVLFVADGELSIEVAGRPVGTWPIGFLSPAVVGDSIVVSVEGERLLIETSDLAVLRGAFRLLSSLSDSAHPPPRGLPHLSSPDTGEHTPTARRGRHLASGVQPTASRPPSDPDVSIDLRMYEEPPQAPGESVVTTLRDEVRDLENALGVARTQLRWVKELTPRRLPIPVRADESGLGVVQGVRLKELRATQGQVEPQRWVAVDWGNVYVTDRRLVFDGASDVEFEFSDIERKGASRTGLLLGVSSRERYHILEGPGERLAVVLTAAEKVAIGLDPTLPFKETIARLTSEIDAALQRLATESDLDEASPHVLNQPAHSA